MPKNIYIEFFKDSQGAGSIQITANVFGLIEMRKTFFQLSNILDSFNFSDLQFLDKENRINIVAYADTMNIGLRVTDNGTYEWRVTKEKWNEFRHNLTLVYENCNCKSIHFKSDATDKEDLQVVFFLDDFYQFEKSAFNKVSLEKNN